MDINTCSGAVPTKFTLGVVLVTERRSGGSSGHSDVSVTLNKKVLKQK